MSDLPDAHLQLKKRARRRLIGAVAFAGLAAVVLPMVMDKAPELETQEVDIHIPGQDQVAFTPRLEPAQKRPVSVRLAEPPVTRPAEKTAEKPAAKPVEKPEKPAEKPEKPAEKPVEKPVKPTEKPAKPDKPAEKPAKPAEKEKPADKPAKPTEKPEARASEAQQAEAQRAAAILSGKTVAQAPAQTTQAPAVDSFVVLAGTFSNPANAKALQARISELGIKVYTEPFDSSDGKKTRVRAGPFAKRAEAEKALVKMQRIGVNNGKIVAR